MLLQVRKHGQKNGSSANFKFGQRENCLYESFIYEDENIPLAELSQHAFIHREKGSGTRKAIEEVLLAGSVELTVNMTLGNSETIKQAVMADLGISAVSRHSVALELATNTLVELKVEGFPLVKSWYVVHHESKHLSPVARAFVDFVLSAEENVPALCNRFLEHHFVAKK